MSTMDLTESIQPRSDQVNADDLIAGPMTVTIREVTAGAAEQPFDFKLVETDRAYRPSKTMRRVIVNAWGADATAYAGRRLTLYREPSIKFGGQVVGGIRISHMSHITGTVEVMAQTTRGKREKFTVEPLTSESVAATPATVDATKTKSLLVSMNAHDKGELYQRCAVEKGSSLAVVKQKLNAAYDTFGWDQAFPDEPDPVAVLAEFRRIDRANLPSDAVEEFDRFARTGESLDDGTQATLDAEIVS